MIEIKELNLPTVGGWCGGVRLVLEVLNSVMFFGCQWNWSYLVSQGWVAKRGWLCRNLQEETHGNHLVSSGMTSTVSPWFAG